MTEQTVAAIVSTEGLSKIVAAKSYVGKTGSELLAELREIPLFKQGQEEGTAAALIYADECISFPIPGKMMPFQQIPRLEQAKTGFTTTGPRLVLARKGSPLIGHCTMTFCHNLGMMKPLLVRFPVPYSSEGTIEGIFGQFSPKQTWKVVVQTLAESLHIKGDRLILKHVEGDKQTVLFHFRPISELFKRFIDGGKYVLKGKFFYDIADDHIFVKKQHIAKIDEKFTDSEAGRRAFIQALARPMAVRMMKLGDDLLEQASKTDFCHLVKTVVQRLSKEFLFDSNDTLQLVGVKYVLSSVMVSVLLPFASVVCDKTFFYVTAWAGWSTMISQDKTFHQALNGKLDEEDPKKIISKSIAMFLLGQSNLVEALGQLSHDFYKHLREKYETFKIGRIVGPVIMATRVTIEGNVYYLVLTIGFIYIISGNIPNDGRKLFPLELQLDQKTELVCSMPNGIWKLVPIADGAGQYGVLSDGNNVVLLHFDDPDVLLELYITHTLCRTELESRTIYPRKPENTKIMLTPFSSTINASVQVDNVAGWSITVQSDKLVETTRLLGGSLFKPTLEASVVQSLRASQMAFVIFGTQIVPPRFVTAIEMTSPWRRCEGSFQSTVAMSVAFDLLYSPDTLVLFHGSFPFGVSDFAFAISRSLSDLLKVQLDTYGSRLGEYSVSDTPLLHFAALVADSPSIIRHICSKCHVNTVDNPAKKRSALFYALRNKNVPIIQALIDEKIDVNMSDAQGRSPMTYCIELGDMERLEMLLRNGALVKNTRGEDHESPLELVIRHASRYGHFLEPLLRYGNSEINIPDVKGQFITHFCISVMNVDALRRIEIECPNFNPNLYSRAFPHPLHFLLSQKLNESTDHTAVTALLGLKRLNLNVLDANGDTPLISAVKTGRTAVVAALAQDIRCDLNAYNREGDSALSIAVAQRNSSFVDMLLEGGALANQPDARGKSPLYAAVEAQDKVIVNRLLEKGATPNLWFFGGKLPVHLAVGDIRKKMEEVHADQGAFTIES